jgi:hypothetical protein
MVGQGHIITFYSYKGGVGRSMALANTAWLLASNGHRVLAVDWDLEAPGLPHFFKPFLDARMLASSLGLVDLFIDHIGNARALSRAVPSIEVPARQRGLDLSRCLIPLDWEFPAGGAIDLLSAGKPDPTYPQHVAELNWDDLYLRFNGKELIQSFADQFRARYDYTLVDSRTGINDSSGICTIQIPDTLVICFAEPPKH